MLRNAPSVCWGRNEELKLNGQIGGAVLKRFKAIFDYSISRMILEPGQRYREPF